VLHARLAALTATQPEPRLVLVPPIPLTALQHWRPCVPLANRAVPHKPLPQTPNPKAEASAWVNPIRSQTLTRFGGTSKRRCPPTLMPRTPLSIPGRALPGALAGWPTSKPKGVPPVTPTPCLQQQQQQTARATSGLYCYLWPLVTCPRLGQASANT